MRQFILAASCLAIIAGSSACAQELGGIGGGGGIGVGGAMGGIVGPGGMMSSRGDNNGTTFTYNFPKGAMVVAVTGAPYSGHMSTQSLRTLSNGVHLVQPSFDQPMTYRDTMGRTRTDLTMQRMPAMPAMAAANMPPPQIQRLAEITDPVSGYRYVLDNVHQIAYRGVIQTRQGQTPGGPNAIMRAGVPASRTMPNGATMKGEDLGTQTIMGVPAIGQRTTTTYPIGTYQGNDGPVTTVSESWRSVEYGLTLLSKNNGPDNESTMTMKDFSKEEPDPAVFQVPAGYQIMDEAGEFTIMIPREGR